MDFHERSTLEQVLNLLHGLIGRDDAKSEYRPDLTFVQDKPEDILAFPELRAKEKSPPTTTGGSKKEKSANERESCFLKFTNKELQKMAKYFKDDYLLHAGEIAHIRQKANGTFEIRYRRNGRNISKSGKTIEIAKARFMTALVSTDRKKKKLRFQDYAIQWLENVKKPEVKSITFESYIQMLNVYAFPVFGKIKITEIRPMIIQEFLNRLTERNANRTAELLFVVLKQIFDFAVAEDIIPKSPMALLRKPRYEKQCGHALSKIEEKEFIQRCLNGGKFGIAYLVMLYTGIRRAEYQTLKISDQWITVITAKNRRGFSAKTRKIPIVPMLKKFLHLLDNELPVISADKLTHRFPDFCPGHHLHELRHTFITRAQECGIPREVVSIWAGHRADNTMTSNVYTHFSDDFQISEAQKFLYEV